MTVIQIREELRRRLNASIALLTPGNSDAGDVGVLRRVAWSLYGDFCWLLSVIPVLEREAARQKRLAELADREREPAHGTAAHEREPAGSLSV